MNMIDVNIKLKKFLLLMKYHNKSNQNNKIEEIIEKATLKQVNEINGEDLALISENDFKKIIDIIHFNDNDEIIDCDIRDYYKGERCVMLGVRGFSENTKIEIDHKDGRKEDWRVSNPATQLLEDFQPLCKAANDVKRQICKECKLTNKRWNAQNIKGNPYPFYEGDIEKDAIADWNRRR